MRGKPFEKGADSRRNTKGRPKNFDALRKLAQSIALETIETEKDWTRIEVILRAWAMSKNPVLQQQFVQIAYGKVPDELNLKGKIKTDSTIKLVAVDYRNGLDTLKPE